MPSLPHELEGLAQPGWINLAGSISSLDLARVEIATCDRLRARTKRSGWVPSQARERGTAEHSPRRRRRTNEGRLLERARGAEGRGARDRAPPPACDATDTGAGREPLHRESQGEPGRGKRRVWAREACRGGRGKGLFGRETWLEGEDPSPLCLSREIRS